MRSSPARASWSSPDLDRVIAAQLRRLIDVSHQRLEHELTEVRFDPLRLDPRRASATVGTTPITLTAGEFELVLVLVLASRPGELVHRHTIARTFGHAQGGDARRNADSTSATSAGSCATPAAMRCRWRPPAAGATCSG